MKVHGSRIRDMEEVSNVSLIKTPILANTKMGKFVGVAFIHGRMGTCMMESGLMDRKMGMGIGLIVMEIRSLGAGNIIWRMGMEYISGPMVIDMKVSGNIH